MKSLKITVSLDSFSADLLRALAIQDDRSLSSIVSIAIRKMAMASEPSPGDGLPDDTVSALEQKHGICSVREALADVVAEK